VLALVVAGYGALAYSRTEVWCGKTTHWNGTPQPDLSLWTAALEVNPDDTLALASLGVTYLRLVPPETEKALEFLNRALQVGEGIQDRLTGDRRIDLSLVYENLGEAYFVQASGLVPGDIGSEPWRQKKAAYDNAAKFLRLALKTPAGFASAEARSLTRLAEISERQAEFDDQELGLAPAEQRESLVRERDELRRDSETSMRRAKELLVAGNVSALDPNYRMVILGMGDIIFWREVGASEEEKPRNYQEALSRYKEAARLLPDDPRPSLYQGICYERLTANARSPEERQRDFALGVEMLNRATMLNLDSADYSPALPYWELAILYTHVNDYRSALTALRKAQQAKSSGAEAADLERDIRTVEQYLATHGAQK
jgi:tetratricopeptide (TPR) repeat protein